MRRPAPSFAALAACLALAACAVPRERAENRESLLAAAGFTTLPANTPQRVASLRALPPNKLMQRTSGGTLRYVYADPLVCGCLYVGDAAAFGRYRQEVLQRQMASEMATELNQDGTEERDVWGPSS